MSLPSCTESSTAQISTGPRRLRWTKRKTASTCGWKTDGYVSPSRSITRPKRRLDARSRPTTYPTGNSLSASHEARTHSRCTSTGPKSWTGTRRPVRPRSAFTLELEFPRSASALRHPGLQPFRNRHRPRSSEALSSDRASMCGWPILTCSDSVLRLFFITPSSLRLVGPSRRRPCLSSGPHSHTVPSPSPPCTILYPRGAVRCLQYSDGPCASPIDSQPLVPISVRPCPHFMKFSTIAARGSYPRYTGILCPSSRIPAIPDSCTNQSSSSRGRFAPRSRTSAFRCSSCRKEHLRLQPMLPSRWAPVFSSSAARHLATGGAF